MVVSYIFNSQIAYGDGDEICYPESDGSPMAESDPTRNYLFYGVETLKLHFQERQDVYVSGNLFIYYERGIPSSVIAPDVFVIFDVANMDRPNYKAWEENDRLPSFVLEITSKTTKGVDQRDKPIIYARLGVSEYFQYDPTGDYLRPCLQGLRLVNGAYEPIETLTSEDGSISVYSEVLGLELHLIDGDLRFYNRDTDSFYPTYGEMAERLQRVNSELETVSSELETVSSELETVSSELETVSSELQVANTRLEESQNALKSAVRHLDSSGLSAEQIATILNLSIDKVRGYL